MKRQTLTLTVIVITLLTMGGCRKSATALYGLPSPTPTQFNAAAEKILGKGALIWTDTNNDLKLHTGELSGSKAAQYVTKKTFTPEFEKLYRDLLEQVRQESVAKELTYTFRKTITTDLGAALKAMPKSLKITDAEIALYKRGTAKLLEVAPFMQQAFDQQAGYSNDLKQTAGLTANDAELIARYTTPWCLGDTSETCTALRTFAPRSSAVLAGNIDCKELGETLTGPVGPFFAVAKKDGKLKTTPFATQYAVLLQPAAQTLREAAEIFAQIPREKVLAQYLSQLALDFVKTEAFPYVASNALWIAHQKSDSIFFARIGPDEDSGAAGGDHCHNKAAFHFNIGFKNFESESLTTQFKPYLQKWEDSYTALVGDPKLYKAQQVAVLLPDFLDIIYQNGDDIGGPNGTNIGQTLPNWCGADGLQEPCTRRTMIYANKISQASGQEILDKYIKPLFQPSLHHYLRSGKDNFKSIVLHELAHNLGPQPGKRKPGTDIGYQAPLKNWGGMIEEFKAQMGSLYFPTLDILEKREAAKTGKLSVRELAAAEEAYKVEMVNTIAWSLSHIARATRSGVFKGGSAYAKLSAATVGYLADKGAMIFDTETKTWKLDFDKFPAAVESLTQKVVSMYARSDFSEVNTFMTHYMSGDGFKQLHVDRLQEVAGKKPSVNINYEISDLAPIKKVEVAKHH